MEQEKRVPDALRALEPFALLVLAIVAFCGCQRAGTPQPTSAAAPPPSTAFVDHVWARTDSTGLPGVMRIFLADGTLVMDSCWETYQLAKWRAESDSVVSWTEGTAEIHARIVELAGDQLVLRLELANEEQDQHYRIATVPFLCPDMRR